MNYKINPYIINNAMQTKYQTICKKYLNKESLISLAKYLVANLAGGFCIGIALYNFAKVYSFPMSGINGITLLLNHFFGIKMGALSVLLNIPIILVCYRFLSKKFVIRSIGTLLMNSIIVDYVCPLLPQYTHETMLAAICTGLFLGLGYAIIFANNTSGGGFDFVTMSIRAVKPYFSIGSLTFIIAAIIITISSIAYKDSPGMIYGIIIAFICATVTDQILNKINAGKLLLIISGKYDEISDVINNDFNRSATLITGQGAYTHNDSHILMCACSDREMTEIKAKIEEIDNKAFTIILNSREVVGKGFLKENSI